jgi:hypothetical protein
VSTSGTHDYDPGYAAPAHGHGERGNVWHAPEWCESHRRQPTLPPPAPAAEGDSAGALDAGLQASWPAAAPSRHAQPPLRPPGSALDGARDVAGSWAAGAAPSDAGNGSHLRSTPVRSSTSSALAPAAALRQSLPAHAASHWGGAHSSASRELAQHPHGTPATGADPAAHLRTASGAGGRRPEHMHAGARSHEAAGGMGSSLPHSLYGMPDFGARTQPPGLSLQGPFPADEENAPPAGEEADENSAANFNAGKLAEVAAIQVCSCSPGMWHACIQRRSSP